MVFKSMWLSYLRCLSLIVISGILYNSCSENPSTSQTYQSENGKFNILRETAAIISPGTLPDWHAQADVQLGWIFDDPMQPENSSPLSGWNQSVGTVPVWSYDASRTAFGHPGQWYIRIPNVVNDNPVKKFWISWVYGFETLLPGERSATNIDWSPDEGNDNESYQEEWFDASGNPTTDFLVAVYARVTYSLDIYPSPDYEDVWLGVFGGAEQVLEVYIITVSAEEVETPLPGIGPGTLPDWHDQADVQLGWNFDDPTQPENSSPLSGWDQSVGTIPVWSYDVSRTVFGHPGQWYIRVPNVVNDNPVKKFWISWVYGFDTLLPGERSATNINWSPDDGSDNESYLEEWFDASGNPTTDFLVAVYARVTYSLDIYPSPDYEDIWLGVFGGVKQVHEVYIKTVSAEEGETPLPGIGPGTLPDWHAQADVQLGWIFDDPTQPENSSPLSGWDQSVGTVPVWSYDASRTAFGHPGQWYIRIPNVVNDNPVKKFWISWVYGFDTLLPGERSATNINWSPDDGSDNESYLEEWFDASGNPTTDFLVAVHARVTYSLDIYPSPDYEDVWLGVFGGVKQAEEVYIKSMSVPGADGGEITIDIKPGSLPNSINPRNRGVIPVAVLTTNDFDATDLDPSTIVFGPAKAPPDHYAWEHVDDDGNIDLILHFRTQKTGIQCGDTEAELSGQTKNGKQVHGSDSIRTVGC